MFEWIKDEFEDNEQKTLSNLLESILFEKRAIGKPKQIREIVPVERWLESEYFMGPDYIYIYDFWKDVIKDVFDPKRKINEVIIDGGIGCLNKDTRIPTNYGLLKMCDVVDMYKKGLKIEVLSEKGLSNVVGVKDNGVTPSKKLLFK